MPEVDERDDGLGRSGLLDRRVDALLEVEPFGHASTIHPAPSTAAATLAAWTMRPAFGFGAIVSLS